MTTVAQFEITYTQFLNAKSELTQSLPPFATAEELQFLYRTMTLIRMFDAKAITLQRTGKMGTYASILGQEAISTALGRVMHKEDVLCPFYRDYAAQYQRGIGLHELLTYWGGDERGSCFAHNREDLPISVPIGSQCLHAAGIGFAFKYRKQPRVAVVTCGDGATSQGDFYEAMNVVGAWQLPVVFVINNNQWAISVPRQTQTGSQTLAQKAIAAGLQGQQVDGNDIIACYDAFHTAIEKARAGKGASVIEAITYRLCDHTTADDASHYRSQEEVDHAWQEEPIVRLRNYLVQQKQWNDQQEEALKQECTTLIEKAVQNYLNRTDQPLTSIFDYMYESWPDNLGEQRDYALDFLHNHRSSGQARGQAF